MDTAWSQPDDLDSEQTSERPGSRIPNELSQELWVTAEGPVCGLTCEEFSIVLSSVGEKFNFGLAGNASANAVQAASFLRSLRLPELALAHACALGREAAWQRFLDLYRTPLTQAAVAITGSATLGHDLADSLYAELYGLSDVDGKRRCPLASYSGRGSLLGWLRTTLAQRHIDHHRRTRREAPLDGIEPLAPNPATLAPSAQLSQLTDAISHCLQDLSPADRFMLSWYYLDRRTLLEISRVLRVHEATVSRRLNRLVADLCQHLILHLQSGGLSKRASEEALGADPRDIELNLRSLLQTSQTAPFSESTVRASDKL